VPYLKELGIGHLYCSPYFQAAPGSTHGYDVVDHSRANEELGEAPGDERLCAAIERNGMRQLLDIVPNHMAITGRENPWWWDVLQNGPSSLFAAFFDVDWAPPERRLHNMMLLPLPSPAATDLGNITRRNRDRRLFAAMLTQLIHDDPASPTPSIGQSSK
jgi:(1->4)-alpha-D-glucan 1-alpha-D-glucosylmutase